MASLPTQAWWNTVFNPSSSNTHLARPLQPAIFLRRPWEPNRVPEFEVQHNIRRRGTQLIVQRPAPSVSARCTVDRRGGAQSSQATLAQLYARVKTGVQGLACEAARSCVRQSVVEVTLFQTVTCGRAEFAFARP